jgi:hypothetical protein
VSGVSGSGRVFSVTSLDTSWRCWFCRTTVRARRCMREMRRTWVCIASFEICETYRSGGDEGGGC